MPTYDYRCQDCNRRFQIFMSYSEYGSRSVACPHCNSTRVTRRIGRIRIARSEASRVESLSEFDGLGSEMPEDPRELGRMMRKMSSELGEEMPAEFNEMVGRLERGESPEQIEKSMPDLDEGAAGGGLGGEDF